LQISFSGETLKSQKVGIDSKCKNTTIAARQDFSQIRFEGKYPIQSAKKQNVIMASAAISLFICLVV